MSKPARKKKASAAPSMTRDDLSFTARIPCADASEPPRISNWAPAEVPYQKDQWSIGHAIGAKMIDELASLADVDEQEAFDAIRFAANAPTWRNCGHGVESGFSDGVAALAMIGLRYLSKGARPFDPKGEQASRYWTGERLVNDAVEKFEESSGPLRALFCGRAQGVIATTFNLGLIDWEFYNKSYARLE